MGPCSRRHFLLSTCLIQIFTIIERQVFDFLGYMWTPIFANFFHIIFVIFGFYGTYLLNFKYIITYLIWNIIWIGWNSFLISFYLDVGILNKNSDILNLGTGSVSWFEVNGYGCKPIYPTNITSDDPFRPVRPEHVYGCLIDYPIVEVIHSGLQFILSTLALIGATSIVINFVGGNDGSNKINKKNKQRQSFYSIEFGPSAADTIRGSSRCDDHILNISDDRSGEMSPKPMTPRRVKRRSVMTRGTTSRRSSSSGGGGSQHNSNTNSNRNSMRNSRRNKYHQNPITKLMDQQQNQQKTIKSFASFSNSNNLNLKSVNTNHNIINSNKMNTDLSGRPLITGDSNISNNYDDTVKSYNYNFSNSISPDPVYYNTHTIQFQKSRNSSNSPIHDEKNIDFRQNYDDRGGGHFNPSYQNSTPNLNNTTNENDCLYNNRPPSVRSSYSNFHGTRPLSSYNSNSENVFVGITGGGLGISEGGNNISGQSNALSQVNIQNSTLNTGSIATISTISGAASQPQVPSYSRRSMSKKNIRSSTFLDNGPPAYNLNYHTPPDSETTM